jgi:serine phosphatase RsbU (regulator of sigma subunit)
VIFSDGLIHAGSRYGESMDVPTSLQALLDEEDPSPQMIADDLLEHAMRLDRDRPADDISIVVLRVTGYSGDEVRRMTVRLPLGN